MKKKSNSNPKDALPLALALQSQGDYEGAKLQFLESLKKKTANSYVAYYSLAAIESNAGQLERALNYAEQAVSANKNFPNSHLALSIIQMKLGNLDKATRAVQEALRINPDYKEAQQQQQALLKAAALGANQSASSLALSEVPVAENIGMAIGLAEQQVALGNTPLAIAIYQAYIKAEKPMLHAAFFNLGVILCSENRQAEAEAYLRQAIHLSPDFFMGHLNLGMVLETRGLKDEALALWNQALAHEACTEQDMRIKLLNNVGRLSEMQRYFDKAEAALKESLQLDNTQSAVIQHWFHLRQKQCNWPTFYGLEGDIEHYKPSFSPLAMLAASDDPAEQLACSKRFVEEKVGKFARMVPRTHRYGHDRIRIAFLSSDLSMHAVSLLTVELFETLDRAVFEVYAYCWSKEDGTPFRQRVINGFDHFNKVGHLDDETIARQIVADEIDVVVDLQGITSGARPNIVARGPAPIQITWLGYPGPTALPHVDYVIADRFIFPEELKPYFTEAPLYMDTLFQVSDSQRVINPTPPRSELGLPEDKFVYCAFNNNYKITPEMFGCWMRILQAVPDSVLWMLGDNEWSTANFRKAAMVHGVDPARLIFAGRALPADYLGRFGAADLFLDTYPYNAGTTANDALWAGLPLLTLSGKTYVSRMAGSLLQSIKIKQTITYNTNEFEKKAINIASNRPILLEIKKTINESKEKKELFNTKRFELEFQKKLKAITLQQP